MNRSTNRHLLAAFFAVAAPACAAAPADDSDSTADALQQGATMPIVRARWSAGGLPASSLEQVVTVTRAQGDIATTIDFADGYVGLQTVAGEHRAVFAWRGATAASSAGVVTEDVDGDVGRSARITYNWLVGRAYRLRVEHVSTPQVAAKLWRGTIIDTTTNLSRVIGEIALPAASGGLRTESTSSLEYTGRRFPACRHYTTVDVSFLAPRFDGRQAWFSGESRNGGACAGSVDKAVFLDVDVARLTLGNR